MGTTVARVIVLDAEELGQDFREDEPPALASLAPLRTEVMHGDLRPLYLM